MPTDGTCRAHFTVLIFKKGKTIAENSKVSVSKVPILTDGGPTSMKKHLFILLLLIFTAAGCTLLDRQPAPNVEVTPPYWQPQSQLAQEQLAELRAFHEKESAKMSKMSDEIHIVRNREIERLEAAEKFVDEENRWQEDYAKTLEKREKWTSWFKKKKKDETPLVSNRTDSASKNTR